MNVSQFSTAPPSSTSPNPVTELERALTAEAQAKYVADERRDALDDAIWFVLNPNRRFRVRPLKSLSCEADLCVVVKRTPEGYLERHFRRPDDFDLIENNDHYIAEALAELPTTAVGGIRWFP